MTRADPARLAAALTALGGAATLGGALFLQHVLGVEPCHLCLVQRHPHYAALSACLLALLVPLGPRPVRALLALAAGLYATSLGLAVHHSLVEAGIVAAPTSCAASALPMPGSAEAFAAGLRGAKVVACDKVGFRLLGASLANWNALVSVALLASSLLWACAPGRRLLDRAFPETAATRPAL